MTVKKVIFILVLIVIQLASFSLIAQNQVNKLIVARNKGVKGLANLDTVRVYGFAENIMENPGIPGPIIYANEGDSVHLDLWNISQGAPHTIHLHGLDVDQQNDGVPHLSFDVAHMEHGFYHFKAPHAGTYIYHCHVASTVHVQAGMYGLVIIRPPDGSASTWENGYNFDKEYSYFMSEIDTIWHNDTILDHDHDTTVVIHYVTIPRYEPQFYLINGFSDQQLAEEQIEVSTMVGKVNYFRVSNIGFYANKVIFPAKLNAIIIDSDGRPLPAVDESDTVYVFPGERYGVLCTATEEFTDSIQFEYLNMNTMQVHDRQYVPVSVSGVFGVAQVSSVVSDLIVSPNPFASQTKLVINMMSDALAKITIIDVQGKVVAILDERKLFKGDNQLAIDTEMLKSGVYIVKLNLDDGSEMSKTVIRK